MEIAKLILEYLAVLIWPLITFVTLIMFKEEIKKLTSRISKAKLPGGIEFDIDKDIEKAADLLPKVIEERQIKIKTSASARRKKPKKQTNIFLSSQHKKFGIKATPSNLDIEYYKAIAKGDSVLALAGIRIELEIIIKNIASRYDISVQNFFSPSKLASQLLEKNKITKNQYELALTVFRICNAAIHGKEITAMQVDEVIEIAKVLFDDYKAWLDWGFRDIRHGG